MLKHGSKMTLSKNDTGSFGVSLEVFLACSEAPLSRFDLRRVVCFTYPQCAFQTMHALQKEVNGVEWCCTKRRETHPLQLGPSTKCRLGLRTTDPHLVKVLGTLKYNTVGTGHCPPPRVHPQLH